EALLGDAPDQEAHLVQVPREHDLRALLVTCLFADEAAEPVAAELAHALQLLLHDLRDVILEAGHAVRVDEFLEEFQCAVHGALRRLSGLRRRLVGPGGGHGQWAVARAVRASASARSSMRATSWSYVSPFACAAMGTRLVGVMPGTVFTSST